MRAFFSLITLRLQRYLRPKPEIYNWQTEDVLDQKMDAFFDGFAAGLLIAGIVFTITLIIT